VELLERDPILQELTRLLGDATSAGGRLVAVCGEAGAGKSAVVDRFSTLVPARHLRGMCDSLFTPRPLGPLLDIVHQSVGPLRAAYAAGAARDRLFRAFLEELAGVSPPTVIVIEDVHWADEATLDLLKFAGRRMAETRGLLVITYRDDEIDPDHRLYQLLGELPRGTFRRIQLPLLTATAVEELARRSGHAWAGLHALTGGNPFFVTEVLAASGDAVPISIRDAVLARAGRLSAGARRLLDVVSIVPGRTERKLLDILAGDASGEVAECVAAGMLVPAAHSVAFRHELARRAWESTLDPAAATSLHARVLDALLERGVNEVGAARLVHHAERAGASEQVLWLAPAAAREASAVGAHREAVAHLAAALRYQSALAVPEQADLLESYSFELHFTGEMEMAVGAAQAALALRAELGDRRREGAALRWLSRLAWWQGRREQAMQHGAAAIRVLEPLGVTGELAMAYSNLSQLSMLSNDAEPAIHWGRRAIALAEQVGDRATLAHALINVAGAEVIGDWARGWASMHRALGVALEQASQEHAVRAHTLMACQSAIARNYALAVPASDAALRYARENDIDAFVHYLLGWRAQLQLDRGEWAEAERDADTVLTKRHVNWIMRFPALVVAGHLRARRGEPGAESMLDEAVSFAHGTGELQRIGPATIARAEAAWLAGDAAAARTVASAGYEVARLRDGGWYRGALAFWLWRCDGLEQLPDNIAEPYRLHISGDWRAAADMWAALGCPYERALALADGDAEARRESFDILERLGARATVGALRRDLRGRGVRALPRGPRQTTRQNPAGITASQMKVLMLLARGLPNAEIARQLYLSPRTVDHHVSAILAKLGVRTRGEVADAARGRGLTV
jgi:DNA-binding CsgD family transcriptional regulator/tetratricopeptide (TPR) repeat protein